MFVVSKMHQIKKNPFCFSWRFNTNSERPVALKKIGILFEEQKPAGSWLSIKLFSLKIVVG